MARVKSVAATKPNARKKISKKIIDNKNVEQQIITDEIQGPIDNIEPEQTNTEIDTTNNNKVITKRNKPEWSKIFTGLVAFIFGLYGMWCGVEYYKLCKIAVENNTLLPAPDLAVVCVSVVLASLLSYCLYQGYLKGSLNKNGLAMDPRTGMIKSIVKGEVGELIEQVIDTDSTNEQE